MRPLAIVALAALGAAAICFTDATAFGQRYVPLRYDLRLPPLRHRPGPVGYGYQPPARVDPYSFEAVQLRNYFVTGNVRAGKSFQGSVPYTQSGSELAMSLPSLSLSNFRRDSVSVADIGTGVEYGAPLPYFAKSAGVTTAASAGIRFAPPPIYVPPLPDLFGTAMRLPESGESAREPTARPYSLRPQEAATEGEGIPAEGIPMPKGLWEWLERLTGEAEGERPPPPGPDAEERTEWFTPGFEGREPENIFNPDRTEPSDLESEAAESSESLLFETTLKMQDAATQPEAGDARSWTSVEGLGRGWDVAATPIVAGSRYADSVRRAHAAMRDGKYREAESLYADAWVLAPDRFAAVFGRVHALLGLQHYHQAALAVGRLLTARPRWIENAPNPAAAYPAPEAFERIVTDLKTAVSRNDEDVGLNFLLGYVLHAAGREEEARPYLERAAALRGSEKGPERTILDALARTSPE
ncbi:MAG: hypothetical protein WBC59_03500 [Phycisphaerae bacterium]